MNQHKRPLTELLLLVPTLVVAAFISAAPTSAQLFTLNRTFDDPNVTTTDNFGLSVAVDGNRILIGAQRDDTNGEDVGQAHLFDATTGDRLQTFDEPTANCCYFGHAVALDGDRVLIGNAWRDPDTQAHLFDTSGNLLHTFNDPTSTDPVFGRAVAVDGNHILIADPADSTNGQGVGQVHLFDATTFTLLQTFDDPTPSAHGGFGSHSIAIDGNRIIIGDRGDDTHGQQVGQAHLFDTSGNLLQTFDDPTVTEGDHFGSSVALDGNRVLIGGGGDDTHGENVGQAHLFDTSGNLLRTFDDPTVSDHDIFGYSLALDGNRVLIGVPQDDTHGENVGQAHLFNATTGSLLQTFDDPTVTERDGFGYSLALDGNRVLIGVPGDDTHGENVGQAYLFTPSCDFNADGLIDVEDIDGLIMEIAAGTNDPTYDLDGNNVVNVADRDEWLAQAGALNLVSGNPYLVADINLDGFVDGNDFIEWNRNKFTNTAKWSLGDVNGDGVTDGVDFIEWNRNKFMSSDGVSAVPEPGLGIILAVAVMCLPAVRRRCPLR